MIDALDECTDRQAQEFIQKIKKLSTIEGLKIGICFSSRDEPDIAAILGDCPRISVDENNSKDIAEHVKVEMDKLPGFTPAERETACLEITQKAGCFFRYVELAMDFMRRPWRRPLSAHLASLPPGVDNIYAQRLDQVDPTYYDLLTHCLTWTILAGEELSVEELIDGYKGTISDEESSAEDTPAQDSVGLELYEEQIRQAGSGFLRVNADHTVSLVHNTVRDFFLEQEGSPLAAANTVPEFECQCDRCQKEVRRGRKFVVSPRKGHMQIITTILQHLLSPNFQRRYYAKPSAEADEHSSDQSGKDGDSDNVNEEYPASALADAHSIVDSNDGNINDTDPENTPAVALLSVDNNDDNVNDIGPISVPTDAHSIMDSDEHVDLTEQDWARLWDLPEEEDYGARYEISKLSWHLSQLEEIYPAGERSGEEWLELKALLEKFLDPESEAWKGWIGSLSRACLTEDCMGLGDDIGEIHPLIFAACCGLTSVAQLLLARPDASAIVDVTTSFGTSALWLAIAHQLNSEIDMASFFQAMLDGGANPNGDNSWDDRQLGSTFHLLLTCRVVTQQQLNLFIEHGAQVDTIDKAGAAAIHYFAAGRADLEIGVALVKAGANVHRRNSNGETLMYVLARRNNFRKDIMQYFIENGAEVDAEDDASERPLYEAAQAGHSEAVEPLLDHGADLEDVGGSNDQTALFVAAWAGHAEVVKVLLQHGADPFKKNSLGATPFGMACKHGDSESALVLGKAMIGEKAAELLDWQNPWGKTPLMRAASRGLSNVIDFIIAHANGQAALKKVSKKGWSPLHYAALRARPEATVTLLRHGADTQCKDLQGITPLQLCYAKVVNKPDEDREETISVLIDHDPQTAITDIELLHTLTIYDSHKLVTKLLELGANPYLTDDHGWNALQLAKQYDRISIVELIKQSKLKASIRPSRFVGSFSDLLVCAPSGLEIELLKRGEPTTVWLDDGYRNEAYTTDQTLITEHPISSSAERYYFEMSIADSGIVSEEVFFVIGITQKPSGSTKRWVPGWSKAGTSSWGYHSDDGQIWCVADPPKIKDLGMAKTYGYGETVGCGVDLKRRTVFWTLNGKRLMEAGFQNVRGQIYPAICLSQVGKVQVNLGLNLEDQPFLWSPGNTLDFESDIPPPTLKRTKTERS